MKQLEQNLQQSQAVSLRLSQLDSIKTHFFSNISQYKLRVSSQISDLFLINDLKEDLKKKDLKPIEKQQLWDRFKDENLLFDVMGLTISPLVVLTRLIKEMILGKLINKENSKINSKIFVDIIEKIMENFIEHLNETGIKEAFFYVKNLLQEDLTKLRVTNEFDLKGINDIFAGFEGKLLKFIEKPKDLSRKVKENVNEKGVYWKNGISEKLTGVDYNEIGNYLIGKSRNTKKTSEDSSLFAMNSSKKLSIPTVILQIIKEFLSKIKTHSILNDKKYLIKEIETLRKIENSDKILDSLDKSPTKIIDENLIFQKSIDENSKEHEGKTEENVGLIAESIMGLCQEIIDWLESSNFQVLFYHYIRFNFFKFKTRLLLFKQKTRCEKLKLANYLTIFYRISNEEFLAENAEEINESFYKTRIKNNLSGSSNENDMGEMLLNVRILEEYELSLRLKESLDEVLKRVYLEEYFQEKELQGPVDEKNVEGKEFNDIMTILKQLG